MRIFSCIIVCASLLTSAEQWVFPADAGVFDVKRDYGAKGDGTTDDTKALQQAISDALDEKKKYAGSRYFCSPIVYLPNGRYVVSERLETRLIDDRGWSHGWRAGVTIVGQERDKAVIRLKDTCPGFTDPKQPKAMLRTGTENCNEDGGSGNEQAFRHTIRNLTFDVGVGNPGASGVDLLVNNRGGMDEVTVRSSDPQGAGYCGVDMTRFGPGPGMVARVSVEGFDYGMRIQHGEVSMTFEHISFKNQRVAGFWNDGNWIFARKVTSVNSVPVFMAGDSNRKWGHASTNFTLAECDFSGGKADVAAIQLALKERITLLDIKTSGYGKVVSNPGGKSGDLAGDVDGKGVATKVWTSYPAQALFTPSIEPLRLKVVETPVFTSVDPKQWMSVKACGAVGDDKTDDSAAIQKAIDSGASVVYFPRGLYKAAKTIHLRGKVRLIVGCTATLGWSGEGGQPLLSGEDGAGSLTVENMNFIGGYVHDSKRTIAFRHVDIMDHYTKDEKLKIPFAIKSGTVVFDDCQVHPLVIRKGASVYARQLNIEADWLGTPYLDNQGGTLWMLGLKVENDASPMRLGTGSRTELIGAFIFNNKDYNFKGPVADITNAQASLSFGTARKWYNTTVQETRGGETKTLLPKQLPIEGGVTWLGMYTTGR